MFKFLKTTKKLELLLIMTLAIQGGVNLIGALGPELGFDALWYHLTIPKLYLEQGKVFIPGNLLYYSGMPKLIEILYIPAIYIGGEILAKLVHFSLGVGTLIVLYRLSQIFLPKTGSLLVSVVFYSNLVVAWQSTTAYIDLGRTFFEILGLYFLLSYFKYKKEANITKSAISIGLAISSKLLGFGSLVIFTIVLFLNKLKTLIVLRFILIALIIPMPWFIFSYVNTGNPVYPFFEKLYPVAASISITNIINLVRSPDPISPIYLIMFPLILISWKKFDKLTKIVGVYSVISFLVWFVIPQTGGGRFIMPYLPAYSLIVVITVFTLKQKTIRNFVTAIILYIALISIIYRGVANSKYLPVLIGRESKHEFLSKNLNFDFGDFYDTDYYFENNIKSTDKVLIYGTHNLYYVNFPFIHESWRKPTDKFNYVMTQNADLPEKFSDWKEVYSNKRTHVKLYSKE